MGISSVQNEVKSQLHSGFYGSATDKGKNEQRLKSVTLLFKKYHEENPDWTFLLPLCAFMCSQHMHLRCGTQRDANNFILMLALCLRSENVTTASFNEMLAFLGRDECSVLRVPLLNKGGYSGILTAKSQRQNDIVACRDLRVNATRADTGH